MDSIKKLVVGLVAHVDAGKTTLAEALLYAGGTLRRLGRVDHRDTFLDTEPLERERGITIFSKQAVLALPELTIQLLDTPGHTDFSSETERTLPVLDCAILVISGTDGVQPHTRTLWRLLEQYRVPVFLFVNKMDLAGAERGTLLAELKRRLSSGCVDFSADSSGDFYENVAMCDEDALGAYLEHGALDDAQVAALIAARRVFPVWFGAALRLDGVEELLGGLRRFARCPDYPPEFGARVYKIARDAQGNRLTYLKVTGGTLKVKTLLTNRRAGLSEEQVWEEKADQLRICSGTKYQTVDEAPAGTVCAVTGLTRTRPGDGLGAEASAQPPVLEPVLNYQALLPDGCDVLTVLRQFRELEEEDPQLHVVWNGQLRRISVQLMGEVHREVLRRLMADRFGLNVDFGPGKIVYRETIADTVEGIGHFEPLRHYAEVHLLLEPGERGSGIQLATACSEDQLDRNWQRLIFSHLLEREFPGVLTGAPVTDLKITLLAGRAHEKHTEGGDFRQAVRRAVRQGLMQAQSVLLEPWYRFHIELPPECVGRALSDVQHMGGSADPPETAGEASFLTGMAPVAGLQDYAAELAAYSRGRGRISCMPDGYRSCHNQAEAVAAADYDPERDADNPSDSVFCLHGGGISVPWREVAAHAHIPPVLRPEREEPEQPQAVRRRAPSVLGFAQDKELQAIYERTYGPAKQRDFRPRQEARREEPEKREILLRPAGPEYLLVDGYNVIFAWEELSAVARDNLDAARKNLMDLLSNYQGFARCTVILVFDAYKVPHGTGEVGRYHNLSVVYTKESQTADAYIEKATYEIGREHRVRVVTSDGAEQLIILGHGALRIPASAFRREVEAAEGQIASILLRNNRGGGTQAVRAAMERAQSQKGKSPE